MALHGKFKKLAKVVDFFRKEVSEEVTLRQILIFLVVGEAVEEEGRDATMQEVQKFLGIEEGVASRNIRAMSRYLNKSIKEPKIQGLDLLDARPGIDDRRRLDLFLTEYGRNIYHRLEKVTI